MVRTAGRFAIVVGLFLGAAGCATAPQHNVHYRLIEEPAQPPPKRVLLLPPKMVVKEISAGGVTEEVPEWTAQATENVTTAVREYAAGSDTLHIIDPPAFEPDERAVVDEHRALYQLVAGNAFLITKRGGPPWKHKVTHFDYTLGPGMQFLTERTDARAALFVIGEDAVSSPGRKAAFVIGAVFGVGVPLGHSFITGGVVDLETGDLLWLHYDVSGGSRDLRKLEDARAMVANMLDDYPGVEEIKEFVKRSQ